MPKAQCNSCRLVLEAASIRGNDTSPLASFCRHVGLAVVHCRCTRNEPVYVVCVYACTQVHNYKHITITEVIGNEISGGRKLLIDIHEVCIWVWNHPFRTQRWLSDAMRETRRAALSTSSLLSYLIKGYVFSPAKKKKCLKNTPYLHFQGNNPLLIWTFLLQSRFNINESQVKMIYDSNEASRRKFFTRLKAYSVV